MTTREVAVRVEQPQNLTMLSNAELQMIAKTEFVPPGLRGNIPAILACVATGRALGIADTTALRSIHVIDGKATFSAELMVQLVRRAGHSITGEVTDGSATVKGKRVDNGDEMKSTWTLAMAERAGLLGKSNWKKYPESMLWARAVSQLCRMLFADCFAGSTYTVEEMGEEHTDSVGEPTGGSDTPGPNPDAVSVVSQAPVAACEPASPAEQDDGLFPPVVELPADAPVATKAQQSLILVRAKEAGLDDDARHALIDAVTGQPSSKKVPKALVNAVLAEIDKAAKIALGFQLPESLRGAS